MTTGLARWAENRHEKFSDQAHSIPVTEVLTGHMSMSRETFDLLAGFDPRFTAGGTFGGEDIELGWRARELGVSIIYEPEAVAHQFYEKTFLALAKNIRHAGAADAVMAEKHEEARKISSARQNGAPFHLGARRAASDARRSADDSPRPHAADILHGVDVASWAQWNGPGKVPRALPRSPLRTRYVGCAGVIEHSVKPRHFER